MQLVFGKEVLFDWNEQTGTATVGTQTFSVQRNDWLQHFAGTLDKAPLYHPFGMPVQTLWFERINPYMAPENVQALYYLPYNSICRYLGLDRRINGILVSDLLNQCRV